VERSGKQNGKKGPSVYNTNISVSAFYFITKNIKIASKGSTL
jgi:hypothetical protein